MIAEVASPRATTWLWLSLPIVILALAVSVAGIVTKEPYARETANWSGQAAGQDIANLVAYVILGALAVAAGRGSVRAYLAWTGLIAFSAYSFAIYAFALHFNRLFVAYVAVLGLSVYALVGGLYAIDAVRVRAMMSPNAPVRSTAILLIIVGSTFYLLWLSEVIPTIGTGRAPKAVSEAGLLTSPVHVLDMAVLLPAAILTGVLLLRRSPWGITLAPTILGCLIFIGIGVVAAMLVLRSRGEAAPMGVAAAVSLVTLVEVLVLVRFLSAIAR